MTAAVRPAVMVVEDDRSLRETIQEVLEVEGFRVTGASNGREALDHLRDHRPEVILLDLMMPVMDGWQFRAEMRRDPALRSIPVVVMSADAGLDSKTAGLDAAEVLAKPVPLEQLLRALHRYA